MDKKHLLPVACIAASVLAAAVMLYFASMQNQLIVEGTAIDSGGENALQLFQSFSKKSVFIVSPQIHEPSGAVDHLMFNGSALFLQVLQVNGKAWVHLVRVYNDNGVFIKCVKGVPDMNSEETLLPEQCNAFLSPENGALVMIEFPDETQPMPLLQITDEKIVVKPKTNDAIGKTCFLALRIMFENSQEIIDSANALLGRLK